MSTGGSNVLSHVFMNTMMTLSQFSIFIITIGLSLDFIAALLALVPNSPILQKILGKRELFENIEQGRQILNEKNKLNSSDQGFNEIFTLLNDKLNGLSEPDEIVIGDLVKPVDEARLMECILNMDRWLLNREVNKIELASNIELMRQVLTRCLIRNDLIPEEGLLFIYDKEAVDQRSNATELVKSPIFFDMDELLDDLRRPPPIEIVETTTPEPEQEYEPPDYFKTIIKSLEQIFDGGFLEVFVTRRGLGGPYVLDENTTAVEKVTSTIQFEIWLNYYPQDQYLRFGALLFATGFALQILGSVTQLLLI